MRVEKNSKRYRSQACREVSDLEIEHRREKQTGNSDVDPDDAVSVARRHEQDQGKYAVGAPAVAIIGHRKGILVRPVPDIRGHQGEQADKYNEYGGGEEGEALHGSQKRDREEDHGHDSNVNQEGERTWTQDMKADRGEGEVQPPTRLVKVDMRDMPRIDVPRAPARLKIKSDVIAVDKTTGGDIKAHAPRSTGSAEAASSTTGDDGASRTHATKRRRPLTPINRGFSARIATSL